MVRTSYRFFESDTGNAVCYDEITSGVELNSFTFSDGSSREAEFSSADNKKRIFVWTQEKGTDTVVEVQDIYTGLTGVFATGDTTFTDTLFTDFIDGAYVYCMSGGTRYTGTVAKATGVVTFTGVDLSSEDDLYTYCIVEGDRVFLSMPLRGNKCQVQQTSGDREIRVRLISEEE